MGVCSHPPRGAQCANRMAPKTEHSHSSGRHAHRAHADVPRSPSDLHLGPYAFSRSEYIKRGRHRPRCRPVSPWPRMPVPQTEARRRRRAGRVLKGLQRASFQRSGVGGTGGEGVRRRQPNCNSRLACNSPPVQEPVWDHRRYRSARGGCWGYPGDDHRAVFCCGLPGARARPGARSGGGRGLTQDLGRHHPCGPARQPLGVGPEGQSGTRGQ